MVKIQAFKGFTYRSEDYETLLRFDHESLSSLPQAGRAYINKSSVLDQIAAGLIEQDTQPNFYLYRQIFRGKQCIGLMAELDLQECINGKIKVHELTLCREGYNSDSYSQTHVGPIILSYETPSRIIEDSFQDIVNTLEPYSKWSTIDGREHTLWKLPSATLADLFGSVQCLYVLDGHHRLKAATEWYQQSKFNEKTKFAQVLIYPTRSVRIYPFHRILNQTEQSSFMKCANNKGLQPVFMKHADESTLQEYDILYKTGEGYYGFNIETDCPTMVGKLAVQKLKLNILDELFGGAIESNVSFVPGVINWNELNSKYSNICLVKPIKIQQIFRVADNKEIMPPKSTWFQPKPCNRMVIRLPFQL